MATSLPDFTDMEEQELFGEDMMVFKKDGEGPLISIITVVFNGAKTIEQTILSVIQQSYPKKEFIIIDGGSTDGTQDILRKYEEQIIWISEPDNGIFDAMNKGIKMANGDLIGIINADDWYEENILDLISDTYQKTGKNTVLHGLLKHFLNDEFYSIKGNSTRVLKYDMIQHPTCFIPKALYQNFGVYDTQYKYTADFDLVLRYLNKGVEFLLLERVVANFRIGGASSKKDAQKERILILEKYGLISARESMLRLILFQLTHFTKSIAGIQKN